jgi:hypothetical protein
MRFARPLQPASTLLMSLALAAPGAAFAYDTEDAVRDCEQRIRDEYQLTDLRNSQGTQLGGDKHYRVEGKAKVDGDKYPWSCEVKDRRVAMTRFEGPKHKGMSSAEKVAVGVAAAVAIGAAASQAGKHRQQTEETDRPHGQRGGHGSGATALQDLLGARASSGEMQMEERGYEYVKGEKAGSMAFTNWVKGSNCVTIRTENGHYTSIVDVTMLDCE